MNILIIHNIKSGRKSSKLKVATLVTRLKNYHLVQLLEVNDHNSMLTAIDSIPNNDLIIICGGDGTVSFYSNALVEFDKPLLIIPIGSGNDFATSLGFSTDINKIIDSINNFQIMKISTLLFNNQIRKLSIVCFGFEAKVNRLSNKMPRFLGGVKYTIATIISLFGRHYESLKIESDLIHESGDYSLAIIANSPSFGGGLNISRNATAIDEKMYLILVSRVNRLKLVYLFILLLMRKHYSRKEFREFEVKQVRVDKLNGLLQSQADGESLPVGAAAISIDPFSLKVLKFE